MNLSLLLEEEVRCSALGTGIELGPARGQILQLVLDIRRMSERQTIDMLVWGSTNGTDWGPRPLVTIPRKYYCGSYSYKLDLTEHPDVKFINAEYRVNKPGAVLSMTAEMAHELAMAAAV